MEIIKCLRQNSYKGVDHASASPVSILHLNIIIIFLSQSSLSLRLSKSNNTKFTLNASVSFNTSLKQFLISFCIILCGLIPGYSNFSRGKNSSMGYFTNSLAIQILNEVKYDLSFHSRQKILTV